MDVTYCKSQRRRARTALRNYIVENMLEIEEEFCVIIPENIKNMSGHCFGNWIIENASAFLNKRNEDLFHYELIDLITDFICTENNVIIAESSNIETL